MELGPMPWSDLLELVRKRQLAEDDEVRHGATDAWRQAKSIADLAAEFRLTGDVLPARLESSATARAVAKALAEANAGAPPSRTISAEKSAADDERWHCRIAGAVYGPIRFAELLRLIAHKKLEIHAYDEVRHGAKGDWVRVESIPALMRSGGLGAPVTGGGMPVLPPANSSPLARPATLFASWIDRLPSFPSWELPSWELPDWFRDFFRRVTQSCWFLVRYSTVIVPAIFWITLNIIAFFYPETGEALGKTLLAYLASPVTWFAFVAVTSYAAAIWLNQRR